MKPLLCTRHKHVRSCLSPISIYEEHEATERYSVQFKACKCVRVCVCLGVYCFLPVCFRCLFTSPILLVWLIVYQSISVLAVCAITVNWCLRRGKKDIQIKCDKQNQKTYHASKPEENSRSPFTASSHNSQHCCPVNLHIGTSHRRAEAERGRSVC